MLRSSTSHGPGFSPFLAALYSFLGDGYTPRKLLAFAMVSIWSFRLGKYLLSRLLDGHPTEDQRYALLRKNWAEKSDIKFLFFFELQGLLALFLSLPFALACLNSANGFSSLEYLAVALWLLAVTGETLADWQLSRFKADPANRGKTLDRGLWRFSRHPNYFFEWLVWCAYFVFALGAPYGWVTLYCPLLMYYILTRVTGIPMAEEMSLQHRGESYRRYQERTNRFFPWFPKSSA